MEVSIKEEFFNYMERHKRCSMLTLRNYLADIERLEKWLSIRYDEPRKFESANTDDLREWIVYRMEHDKVSASSMNRELATLRSIYKWSLARGYISTNPIRVVKALKTSSPLPHFIPRSKIGVVVESRSEETQEYSWEQYIEDRNAMLIVMLYYTGLRLSELASLRQSSFNHDYSSLRVTGKGNKERIIPIADKLQKHLLSYINKIIWLNIWRCSDNCLFLTKRGTALSSSSIYKIVRSALGESGVDGRKSPHIMRHTFATHLLNGGADIRVIQELLGHSSLRATQIYTHNSIATLRESYTKAHPRASGKVNDQNYKDVEQDPHKY